MTEQHEMWTPERLWSELTKCVTVDRRERKERDSDHPPDENAKLIEDAISYGVMHLTAIHSVLHHMAVALDRQVEADEEVSAMMSAAQDSAAGSEDEPS